MRNTNIFLFLVLALFIFTGTANSQVTVSGSTGANGSYTTLTGAAGAFNSINLTAQTGNNIVITITANAAAETGAVSLNAGVWTTITISPSGGASRTISGTVTAPMITLNGADNVTINGLNSGGNALTISNLSTNAAASTIKFIGDAINNTVTNCTISGSSTAVTVGTVWFSTGTSTGNTGNNINNCNIGPAGANLPVNAVYSLGTSAGVPNTVTMNANNISDYFSATLVSVGINVGATGNTGWTITDNKLYQTATRIFTVAQTHNGIFIGTGAGYTITGNMIGFANSSGTGTTNVVGNSVALTGTFPSSYTATGTPNATRYIALNCAFTAGGTVSSIQNNTIGGFALYTSSGASTTNGIWCGINITSGNANIGTTTGNTIGAASGTGSIYAACTTTGGALVGIYATSSNTVTLQNNSIGACNASGTSATIAGTFTGIDCAGTGIFTIGSNSIGNSTADNIRTGYFLSGGNLSNAGTITSTSGTTGACLGIRNSSTGTTSSITGNTLRGWNIGGTATGCMGIYTGAVTTSSVIDGNFLGTSGLGWVKFSFASGGSFFGILCMGPDPAATLSVSTNDFRGIVHLVEGTTAYTYIQFNHSTSTTSTINGNTFTNLSVNTTGIVRFIGCNNNMTATGITKVINNSIVTGYTKSGSTGNLIFYSGGGTCTAGSLSLDTNNNFSNVTISGAGIFLGWINGLSGANKTIRSNIFTNIAVGANTATGISISSSGTTVNVINNTVSGISNTGTSCIGIDFTTNSSLGTYTISHNKIYNLQCSNATGLVTGISATSIGANGNIFNNIIGDLRNPIGSNGTTDVVRGISMGVTASNTTFNLSNNTIYLNASAGGTNFSTSCIYHTTSVTATTGTLVLRNNIAINVSLAQGTGIANAYRRSSAILTNFSSTSNKNNYYSAGTGTHNIFYDGTNSETTLNGYKTRVSTADAAAFSENTTFKSTVSSNADFMKVDETVATQCESNGIVVSGITDDFFYIPRYPNISYPVNASYPPNAPDIGANEFGGIDLTGPSISYTPLGPTSLGSNQVLTALITDASGVGTGAGLPRLYWKLNSGSYTGVTGTDIGSNQYTFTFGSATSISGDVISYYVVAQDVVSPTPNKSCQPSIGASGFTINPPAVSTPPTTPNTFTAYTALFGTYDVGTAQPDLKKLTNVAAHLTSGIVTGNIIYELNSDYDGTTGETLPINFAGGSFIDDGGRWSITIRPKAGAGARTTSGSSASSLISLTNADRITFDGREGGTGSTIAWTFQNTNTVTGTACFQLIGTTNGAVKNTIKYCNISCNAPQNTGALTTFGILVGGSTVSISSPGLDNDSTTISNNSITKVRYGIFVNGASSSNLDQDLNISNNTIGPASFGVDAIGKGGVVMLNQIRPIVTQNEIRYIGGDFANTSGASDRIGICIGTDAAWSPTPTATVVYNASLTRNNIHHVVEERSFSAVGIAVNSLNGTNATNNVIANNLIYQLLANGIVNRQTCGIGHVAGRGDLIAYNSIYLTGDTDPNASATAPTQRNAGIRLSSATDSAVTIRNNIVHMNLTSSSTPALVSGCIDIATSQVWGSGSSNYNIFYAEAPSTIHKAGTIGGPGGSTSYINIYGASMWNLITGQDGNSFQNNPAFTSVTNLIIDATSTNAWNVSGTGQPLSSVSIDYSGAARSTTVIGGASDIGAYNVTPSSVPTNLTQTGNITAGDSTVYTLGGKTITRLKWTGIGAAPTISTKYYSGVNPPGTFNPTIKIGNFYYEITQTGGTGFTYDISIIYDEAALGEITSESDIRVAKAPDINGGNPDWTNYLIPGNSANQYSLDVTTNTIILHGLTSFSLFGLTSGDALLPVELSSLTANLNRRNVDLKWSTVSEENNTGFDIERKPVSSQSWAKIGNVQGNGTSNTVHNYRFEDRNLETGKYNYRLKQIDVNGNYKYHNLSSEINVGVPTRFDLSQNYPNPFNPTTKINYDLPFESKVSIKLYDMTGRKVANIVNVTQPAGYYTVQFNGANMASGIYFYNMIAEGGNNKFVTTKKMVLVK